LIIKWEIGYFYNLYKEEGQNSSGGSSSFLTNLGAAARGRKRKGKRKKGSKGSTMDWSSSHMGGFINLNVNPTFNGQLISSLRE
jgi:hypothetical protein